MLRHSRAVGGGGRKPGANAASLGLRDASLGLHNSAPLAQRRG